MEAKKWGGDGECWGREFKIGIKESRESLTENGVYGKDLKEGGQQPCRKSTPSRGGVNASQNQLWTQPQLSLTLNWALYSQCLVQDKTVFSTVSSKCVC